MQILRSFWLHLRLHALQECQQHGSIMTRISCLQGMHRLIGSTRIVPDSMCNFTGQTLTIEIERWLEGAKSEAAENARAIISP